MVKIKETRTVIGADIKEADFLANSVANREKIMSSLNKKVLENIESFFDIEEKKVKIVDKVFVENTIYKVEVSEAPRTEDYDWRESHNVLKYSVKIAQQIDPNTLSRAVDYGIYPNGDIRYSYSENQGNRIKFATQEAVANVIDECAKKEKRTKLDNQIISLFKALPMGEDENKEFFLGDGSAVVNVASRKEFPIFKDSKEKTYAFIEKSKVFYFSEGFPGTLVYCKELMVDKPKYQRKAISLKDYSRIIGMLNRVKSVYNIK